nr:adenylate kinase, chloroplastic isoform X1 [Tanacetum cinerariifolium]
HGPFCIINNHEPRPQCNNKEKENSQKSDAAAAYNLVATKLTTEDIGGSESKSIMASSSYVTSSSLLFSSKTKHQHHSTASSYLSFRRHSRVNKIVASSMGKGAANPLKIMISGAPASGKGTQCELITTKYDLVHVAAGDLLRAEVAAGSENGRLAKEYMEKGQLVPDEIVVMMVKDRLSQPDSTEKGWLLDGYPRSSSQATALQAFGFRPDLFILLEVPQEILVDRVVGRRLDPVTGKIYHLTYSPPETEEIATRLTQRFDDTEEKCVRTQFNLPKPKNSICSAETLSSDDQKIFTNNNIDVPKM